VRAVRLLAPASTGRYLFQAGDRTFTRGTVTVENAPGKLLSRLLELGFERGPDPGVATDAVRVDRRTVRVSAARPAMGTLVTITALARSRERAEEAIGRAFEEMDRLIGILSRFQSDSALSQLNDAGRLAAPPPELSQVLDRALRYHRTTRGVFDISVWPVLELFAARLRGPASAPPSEAEVADALARVGAERVSASRREVRFGREGMAVTVDGIAKGYIVDRMARVLEGRRVRRYLIDGGGDIRVSGLAEGGRPWSIGVRDPRRAHVLPDRIELEQGAVATSGSYERYFDPEHRYHHIIEASAGRSPVESESVTVIAPAAMAADALATSLFIMPPAEALTFVETQPGCECLIIDRRGHAHRSRGWRSATPSHSEEAMLQ
jgi:FAD:protein FMN transferase